jgi:iron complex outermembrane receptor protein
MQMVCVKGFLFAAESGIPTNPILLGILTSGIGEKMGRFRLGLQFLVLSGVIFFVFGSVYSAEIDLDKIVVTPYRYDESLANTPASVSVIDADEISESQASTTVGLLSELPGVVVRDWSGNGSKATVDIRGFGEQAGLNVLVLINGRRVNEIDLSGTDWTQIPIDQIERIEVLRGGFGAVLYGDNAVGGVINIITKRGGSKPLTTEVTAEYGSYNMNIESINLGGTLGQFNYFATYGSEGTHGYRNNSYLDGSDFSSRFDYKIESTGTLLRFSQAYNKSNYGLPGALSSANLAKFNRRYSAFGDDHAKDTDYNFVAGFDQETGDFGKFSFDASYRKRYTFTNFIGANGGYNPIVKSSINTLGFNPKYIFDEAIFSLKNKAILGLDFYRYDLSSDTFDLSVAKQSDNYVRKNSRAFYMQDELALGNRLTLAGGWRYEDIGYDFNYNDYSVFFPNPAVDSKVNLKATAYNIGLTFKYDKGNVYANHSKSFRSPAIDEYFVYGVFNPALKAQTGKNFEVGLQHSISGDLSFGLSGYLMNLKNELYYNPATYQNENYDKTRHRGIEASFKSKLPWRLKFSGSYTFDQAVFKQGDYKNNTIPMVPEHKFNLGLMHSFNEFVDWSFSFNYLSNKYFVNDQANKWPKLKQVFTVDGKIAFNKDDYKLTCGINNIFNEKYYEYGVCNASTGAVNYYPASGRNFFIKASKKF